MPSGGNRNTGKYANKERADGRRYLDDAVAENICYLTVTGETDPVVIIKMVKELNGEDIDEKRIAEIKTSILFQRRLKWLSKECERENYNPKTPEECVSFARDNLVKISRGARTETKDKINANKALVEVSLKQMELVMDDGPKPQNAALSKLFEDQKDNG